MGLPEETYNIKGKLEVIFKSRGGKIPKAIFTTCISVLKNYYKETVTLTSSGKRPKSFHKNLYYNTR